MSAADRARRRVVALLVPALVVPALVVALSGCTAAESQPTASPSSTPSPTRTPYFTSEKAALDAATKTYQAALTKSNEVLQAGGAGGDVLKNFYTRGQLKTEVAGAKRYQDLGRYFVGSATMTVNKPQKISFDTMDRTDIISLYACLDLSNVDVVDGSGKSVVNPKRKKIVPQIVTFDYQLSAQFRLLVSNVENWKGSDFCE